MWPFEHVSPSDLRPLGLVTFRNCDSSDCESVPIKIVTPFSKYCRDLPFTTKNLQRTQDSDGSVVYYWSKKSGW